jgi:hypothetical protein
LLRIEQVLKPWRRAMNDGESKRPPTWAQFGLWVLCGVSLGATLAGAFTFGPAALVFAAIFAGAALLRKGANISAVGAIAGLGAWGFVLAWLNRHGPGDVCSHTATESTCVQQWAPWPFAVGAVLLIAIPAVTYARARPRSRRAARA